MNQFSSKDYKDVKNINLQENKFDFIEIIEHFNIVSKLIELFLTNWFGNYDILLYNDLENIIKTYFENNNDILKYKLLISREILNILTIIYDLNHSYLNAIEEYLLYFFMFVGRDDQCTKFLVHIIKNNKLLINCLCPLSKENIDIKEDPIENEEKINENNSITNIIDKEEIIKRKSYLTKFKYVYLKKCLLRIIKDYNNITLEQIRINFSSLVLFFNLLNNLFTFDNEPFGEFYNDYFKDLGLLKAIENGKIKPNFEQNPILIDFYVSNNDGEIYIKKFSFSGKESRKLIEIKLNDLIDIISNYNYENEEDRDNILLAKLVSLNLFFYSFLSLVDKEFKSYMQKTFQFEILINNYLKNTYNVFEKANYDNINNENEEGKINIIITNENKKKNENPMMNDLKCSIIQVLTYLYLKVPYPFMIKTHLFKIINMAKNPEMPAVGIIELKRLIKYIDEYVLNKKEENFEIKLIDQYCLIQMSELIQYILRNLYLMKTSLEEEDRDNIYNLISKVTYLLQKILGLSKKNNIQANNDKNLLNSIQEIINDKLELNDPILLVSENIQYMFLKYKNKLEEAIQKKNERGNNIKTFLDILSDICDKDRMEKNKYDLVLAELTKKNIKLLRRYNLKGVLMEVSINTYRNNENLTNFTLLTIEKIFQEFMDYLEYADVEGLGEDFKINENISREEYEYKLKNEIINKKCSTKYLDEFMSKSINLNEFLICFYFLKLKNTKLQNLSLDILYKLNNAKKIFYFNMDNLVIMKDEEEYTKFLEIKNIFKKLIEKMKNLNAIQRLDQNSIKLFKDLNENIKLLLKKSFNENKRCNENNELNKDEDLKSEDSIDIQIENHSSNLYSNQVSKIEEEDDKDSGNHSDKEGDKKDNSNDIKNGIKNENSLIKEKNISDNQTNNKEQIFSFNSKKSEDIIDSSSKDKEKSKQSLLKPLKTKDVYSNKSDDDDDDYFINEYDKESLQIYQQTIYNLGFISFINDFFTYIDKLSETKSELTGDLLCLEEILISIYKILVVFITDNQKCRTVVENMLYLYLCPLKIKKISYNLLNSLNYCLFHLVYNLESKEDYGKIRHIDIVIDRLYLLHKLDWNKYKKIMPDIVRTLLIFFEYTSPEYIYLIFQLLDDIKNIVTTDILNGDVNKNNRFVLTKLLEFIENEPCQKEFLL